MAKFDMRGYAKSAGQSVVLHESDILFNQGDLGDCLYIVQSGLVELIIHDRVIDVCGPNDVIGLMAVLDDTSRTSMARVKEAAELSRIDKRTFRYMVDEVPFFALYMMDAMARRLREVEHGM